MKKIKIVKEVDEGMSEKDIQTVFEQNIGTIEEGLQHIASFTTTGAGTIDSLAIDEDLRPVVIEFKKPGASERDALIQALDYYVWCRNNLNWLRDCIIKVKPGILPEDKLNEDVRIIVVAREFEDRIQRAAFGAEPDTMLISYALYQEESSDTIRAAFKTIVDTSTEKPQPPLPKTEEDHLRDNENMRPLYNELKKRVMGLGDDVRANPTPQYYIAFVRRTNFCAAYMKRNYIRLHLPLVGVIQSERFKPEAKESKWGYLKIHNLGELDEEVMQWIKTAYEKSA